MPGMRPDRQKQQEAERVLGPSPKVGFDSVTLITAYLDCKNWVKNAVTT